MGPTRSRRSHKTAGGHSGWLWAYAVIAGFLLIIDATNVMTALGDAARAGRHMPVWHPVAWETTSGLATLAACWIIGVAVVRARPGSASWGRLLLAHAIASVIFSLVHVGLMVAARMGIHMLAGETYRFLPSDWLYEYRKDTVAYLIFAPIFWFFLQPRDDKAEASGGDGLPQTINVPQGAGFVKVAHDQLVTVRASGNYVEYELEGGRTLLVRTSLNATARELSGFGMVRTHRSWLVNPSKVVEARATASGDFRLMIQGGMIIPLTRRYRSVAAVLLDGRSARHAPFDQSPLRDPFGD